MSVLLSLGLASGAHAASATDVESAVEAAKKAAAAAMSAVKGAGTDGGAEALAAAKAAAEAATEAAKAAEAALAAAKQAQASSAQAASGAGAATQVAAAGDSATYEEHIRCEGKNCQIDLWMTRGFRAFSQCQVCHGLDANGSSFAPSLTDKLRDIDYDRYLDVVTNGYQGQIGVMPGWKENPNVMKYVDNLYAYLKARSDGVLPPGKLKRYDR